MKFFAVDVETANADMASICSIGIAEFDDGALVSEWYSLVDPDDFFDPVNVSIHGIAERDVEGAPTFRDLAPRIGDQLSGQIVVTHTHFDRVALRQAAARWSLAAPTSTWLDSARVARRVWVQFARSGYGLANVCKTIGYDFDHHNALEDAKAAGHVILAAMQASGIDLGALLERVAQPIAGSTNSTMSIARLGEPEGTFSGEVIVFTGTLEIPRREAADLAAAIGCSVSNSVTKKTTMLVVGDLDVTRLAGHDKSSKHRKAEALVSAGHPLRIIRETDFRELIATG